MLYLLLSSSLLLILLSGLGQFFQSVFSIKEHRISITALSGIMMTTGIWTLAAFVFPINGIAELLFSSLGVLAFIYFKVYKKFYTFLKAESLLFYSALAITLLAGSFYPFILDHFGYYIPTINWIKAIGIVKGISNLDMLIGQYSTWHILQAGFSTYIDPFFRINTVLILIFIIYIFENKAWLGLVLTPFFFLYAQSPSPDLAPLVISFIIITEVLQKSTAITLLFSLACLAFTIKPTSFWLILFLFLYYWNDIKNSPSQLGIGSFFIVIYILKNLWTFGYPIFPIGFPNFELAWQPNATLLADSKQTALELSYNLQYSYEAITQFSLRDNIINWLNLDGIKSIIHKSFLLCLLFLIYLAFTKKSKIISLVVFCLLIKSIIVLVTSAQYRLFLDVFIVTGILGISKPHLSLIKKGFYSLSFTIILGFCIPKVLQTNIPSFRLGEMMMGWQNTQLLKASNFQSTAYTSHQIGNLKFNLAKDYPYNFNTPIPAISPSYLIDYEKTGIFPQLVSKDFRTGFHWKKLSPKERKELQDIIKNME